MFCLCEYNLDMTLFKADTRNRNFLKAILRLDFSKESFNSLKTRLSLEHYIHQNLLLIQVSS
jgi:hypothetical protein